MNLSFFLETLRLGLTNLHLHKLRSFLTTLGIIFGVLSVITMVAIGEGGKLKTLKEVEQLGSTNIILRSVPPDAQSSASRRNNNVLIYGITRDDLKAIQESSRTDVLPDIVAVVPLRDAGLEVLKDEIKARANAVATTPEFMPVANLSLMSGRFLTQDDMKNQRAVCVLGAGACQQLLARPIRWVRRSGCSGLTSWRGF